MQIQAAMLQETGFPAPYQSSRPLLIQEFQLEGPGPSEVLVEIAYAGLCHSDLSVIDGSRPRVMPMVLGHEASGVVRAVGDSVRGLAEGDHVVTSFVPACGRCAPCAAGRPALCEPGALSNAAGTLLSGSRRLTHIDHPVVNHHLGVSAFANYAVLAEQSLIKIDSAIPLDVAAIFGCAVLTGVGAVFNAARPRPGTSLAVFGLGGVGLSAVLGARAAGVFPVVAVDVIPQKLELARSLGADIVIDAGNGDAAAQIADATGGGVDCAIESAGSEVALAQAYRSTVRGGTTITVGLPDPSRMLTIPAVSLVTDEKVLRGSYLGSAVPSRDIPRYLRLFQAGRLPVDRLITGRLTLSEINRGFDDLSQGTAVRQIINLSELS